MKLQKVFDILIFIFKILSLLTFTIIFLYWSITAMLKFLSKPTTSSISYTFGDDGQGYYEFPAITICLNSFRWITQSPNGMEKNCSRIPPINTFEAALRNCTSPTTQHQINPFEKIEDFLQISNMMQITDILRYFSFGNVQGNVYRLLNTQEGWDEMKKIWLPSLNFKKGAFHKLHSL